MRLSISNAHAIRCATESVGRFEAHAPNGAVMYAEWRPLPPYVYYSLPAHEDYIKADVFPSPRPSHLLLAFAQFFRSRLREREIRHPIF
jgi:hypothetical protein